MGFSNIILVRPQGGGCQSNTARKDVSPMLEEKQGRLAKLRQRRLMFKFLAILNLFALAILGIMALGWQAHKASLFGPIVVYSPVFLLMLVFMAAAAARLGREIRSLEQGETVSLKPRPIVVRCGLALGFLGFLVMFLMPHERTHGLSAHFLEKEGAIMLSICGFLIAGLEQKRNE